MPRVLYVRIASQAHAEVLAAAHAAQTSLQGFCLRAILEAADRQRASSPPAAHAASDACTCTVPAGQPHQPECPHYRDVAHAA